MDVFAAGNVPSQSSNLVSCSILWHYIHIYTNTDLTWTRTSTQIHRSPRSHILGERIQRHPLIGSLRATEDAEIIDVEVSTDDVEKEVDVDVKDDVEIVSEDDNENENDEEENNEEEPENNGKGNMKSVSTRFVNDNDLVIVTDDDGRVTARPSSEINASANVNATLDDKKETNKEKKSKTKRKKSAGASKSSTTTAPDKDVDSSSSEPKESNLEMKTSTQTKKGQGQQSDMKKRVTKFLKDEIPKPVISGGFNVVLTHCTADFDSLASAVGLAKLWAHDHPAAAKDASTSFQSSTNLPTFVVLPRGAHPDVQKFLSLHKHLFPIRSLRSLPRTYPVFIGLDWSMRRGGIGWGPRSI